MAKEQGMVRGVIVEENNAMIKDTIMWENTLTGWVDNAQCQGRLLYSANS